MVVVGVVVVVVRMFERSNVRANFVFCIGKKSSGSDKIADKFKFPLPAPRGERELRALGSVLGVGVRPLALYATRAKFSCGRRGLINV